MQEKIFEMLFKDDDVTWQSIIHEAVRSEQMDPWDIDISQLSQRFLEMIRQLKDMDFKISGKIILAAAIMLRLKSNKLVGEDLSQLDRLIAMSEDMGDDFYDELEAGDYDERRTFDPNDDKYRLIPRTPQPRKRKVSVYDLVDALQKALNVKKRRKYHREEIHVEIPKKEIDITNVIKNLYNEVRSYFLNEKEKKMTFNQLLKSNSKEEKIYTFIPLLHLENQQKLALQQEEHLSEINILMKKSMLENENIEVDEASLQ